MKLKRFASIFLCLIILVSPLFPPLAMGNPGWLDGWDLRVKLTIDSGDVDANLTDFPILIYLSDSSGINGENVSFVFDEVGANSLKIAVTLSDGETECYVEIEKWDLGNRQAWLWAKIDSISNVTDTDIYLYYDNDHADNTDFIGPIESTPAELVWDANFILVWHLRDKTTASVADSTDNDNDGTKAGANNPLLTGNGMVDGAQDFSNDVIKHNTFLDVMPDDITFEAFLKHDVEDVNDYFVDKRQSAGNRIKLLITNDNFLKLWGEAADAGNKAVSSDPDELASGTWYYVAGVHIHTAALKCYLDNTEYVGDVLGNIPDGTGDDFHFGSDRGETLKFDGIIDEFRVSNIARTAPWLKASNEAGRDDILDFGAEETPSVEYSRSASQAIGVAFETSRLAGFYRATTQAIGVAFETSRLAGFYRSATQGISVALEASGLSGFYRSATQGISVALEASGLSGFYRSATQGISVALASSRLAGFYRATTQAIKIRSEITGLIPYIDGTTGGAGMIMILVCILAPIVYMMRKR